MEPPSSYNTNVFINCPADELYRPMLHAIVFTLLSCGYRPYSALQEYDGGTVRLDKIKRLISSCRLGIHDISRTEADQLNALPRFNMPFELGLDLGARAFGSKLLARKQMLILDSEPYRFQRFLSDIAGQDIAPHNNCPHLAIEQVRKWLNSPSHAGQTPYGATHIKHRYGWFQSELYEACTNANLEIETLDLNDFIFLATKWLQGSE